MCRERSNVLTHFSVCTADISLSYADSNYLGTANPPEGGRRRGERGGGRVRETMIEWRKRETDMLGEVKGEKNQWGRGACEAVSQHISNEHSDMMWEPWWRRKRALNCDGCIKYGLPVFPLQSILLLFNFAFYRKTKRQNAMHLKCNQDFDVSGRNISHKPMIHSNYIRECPNKKM